MDINEIDQEIEAYFATVARSEMSVLEFWKNAKDLKLMQVVAKHVLSVPVSSVTSERVFSSSGQILTERRTRLLSSNLDKLLFLYKNM